MSKAFWIAIIICFAAFSCEMISMKIIKISSRPADQAIIVLVDSGQAMYTFYGVEIISDTENGIVFMSDNQKLKWKGNAFIAYD